MTLSFEFTFFTSLVIPLLHNSAMLRYVWSVTEESTVVADDTFLGKYHFHV